MSRERIYQIPDGTWYFRVRKTISGSAIGPYDSRELAAKGLERYVEACQRQQESGGVVPRWLSAKYFSRRRTRQTQDEAAAL